MLVTHPVFFDVFRCFIDGYTTKLVITNCLLSKFDNNKLLYSHSRVY